MKKLLLSLGLLLFLSLSLAGCNDDAAKAQGDDEIGQDLLIDVISGAVLENPEGDGFILELEVSPITVFIDERPGNNSGSINTEDFLENFNEIIGDVPPNAILTYRAEDGTAVAVAVKLNSVVFDASESVAEFLVTPLDMISNLSPLGTSVELKNIDEVESPFFQALLFIDGLQSDACGGDVKTLIVEIASEDLIFLQDNAFKLNIAIKVNLNDTFNVVWQSISNYLGSNTYQWSPIFQVFGTNEFVDNVTVNIQTNLVNVCLGQEVTLDSAGILGPASDGGPSTAISFTNEFGLIHPGLAQQLTDPTGIQTILPTFVTPDPIPLGTEVLTPMDEVMVWFEQNIETSTMFSDARSNSFTVDMTTTNTATVRFSNGEWTTPGP